MSEKAKLLDLLPEEVATALRQEVVDELKQEATAEAERKKQERLKAIDTSTDAGKKAIDDMLDILMPGTKSTTK